MFTFWFLCYFQTPFLTTDTKNNAIYMLHDKSVDVSLYPLACIPVIITQLILL